VADKPPTRQAESFRERDDRLARERYEEATGQRRKVIDITPEFLEIAQ
jgi:hypothetical protein